VGHNTSCVQFAFSFCGDKPGFFTLASFGGIVVQGVKPARSTTK
jgi:hypothetical protein